VLPPWSFTPAKDGFEAVITVCGLFVWTSSLIIYWNTKSSWTITALNPYLSQANCQKLLVFMCYRLDSNHVCKLLEMFVTVVLDSITLFSFIRIEICFGQFWFKPKLGTKKFHRCHYTCLSIFPLVVVMCRIESISRIYSPFCVSGFWYLCAFCSVLSEKMSLSFLGFCYSSQLHGFLMHG
jgi:hypothetical protein